MSYARFLWGGSDVYIYDSVYGGIDCCGCRLHKDDESLTLFTSIPEILEHLHEHEMAGDFVPPHVARSIWEDWRDGEFEFTDSFDPEYPVPEEPHPEVMKWWNRRVIRHMYRRNPPAFQDLLIRQMEDGYQATEDEIREALKTDE